MDRKRQTGCVGREIKFCPIMSKDCVNSNCELWDNVMFQCSVLSIVVLLEKLVAKGE